MVGSSLGLSGSGCLDGCQVLVVRGDAETPGELLLRLLRNRNIRPYNARILAAIGGGPYVSDATIHGLGTGPS